MLVKSLRLITLSLLLIVSYACNKEEKKESTKATHGSHAGHDHGSKSVSNEELKKFADINKNLMAQRQKLQSSVQKMVKKQGLSLEKFQNLAQKMQNPEMAKKQDPKDVQKFQSIIKEMQKIQISTQKKSQEIITAGGLNVQTYQQISQQLQKDAALREKFQKLVQ